MHRAGSPYVVTFTTTSASTGSDINVFPFVAGSDTRVVLNGLKLGVVSSDSGEGSFGVKIFRGSTTPLSTAAAIAPTPLRGWAGHGEASSYATAPTTTLASTASASLIEASVSNGGLYEYRGCDIILVPDQRLDVVVSGNGAHLYGTLEISEIGKNPIS
jgi:hypothetical protein